MSRYPDLLEEDGFDRDDYLRHLDARLMDHLYTSSRNPCKDFTMRGFPERGNFDDISFADFPDDVKNLGVSDFLERPDDNSRSADTKAKESTKEAEWNLQWNADDIRKSPQLSEVRVDQKTDLSQEEIRKLLEHISCPECQSKEVFKVECGPADVVDDMNVRYCKKCNAHFGADDSMDLADLRKLISENKVIVKPNTICSCGNDDLDRLLLTGFDKKTGQPAVECQLCKKTTLLTTVATQDESHDEEDEDEDWVTIDRRNRGDKRCSTASYQFSSHSSTEEDSDLIHSQLFCYTCGNDQYDFFEKRYTNGQLTSVKCFSCDCVQQLRTQSIVCPICRNDDNEEGFQLFRDSQHRVVSAVCTNCNNFFELAPKKGCNDDCTRASHDVDREPIQRRVFSCDHVKVGDHVSWKRNYVMIHHAIVVEVRSWESTIRVVEYTGGMKLQKGHFARVQESDVKVDIKKEVFYVYDYEGHCYSPQKVVERAMSRMKEQRYNMLKLNCEHFARWCKTGEEKSSQVKAFGRRCLKACAGGLGSGVREGVVTACRGVIEKLPVQELLQIGVEGGLNRIKGVSGGTRVAAAVKGGAVLFDVFLNLALEVGLFAYCACRANRKYKSGQISKQQYYRELCQTGCECAAGFVGATAGGFLGQLTIPVPFLGSLVGCTLGTLIGRFLGSIAGKKLADRFFDKN